MSSPFSLRPFCGRFFLSLAMFLALSAPLRAQTDPTRDVLATWYKLVLELVRHTPTYSPPVASRSFAYLGITAYEVLASGHPDDMASLAGQLNGLQPLPKRENGAEYSDAMVMQAAMAAAVRDFFGNTGPTGQRAMAAMDAKLSVKAAKGLSGEVVARSEAYGRAIAAHVLLWSLEDGGAVVENMGFPMEYTLSTEPGHWVPTNKIVQQQKPLLPNWGKNRPFVLTDSAVCDLPPPPAYSEDPSSEFYAQAKEVYDTSKTLTDEQKTIARFWSDDPMLSPTPPGHWVSIVLQIGDEQHLDAPHLADALVRLGVGVADAFIGNWHTKYKYDLIRPISYIKAHIDPKWEALLITPPFPEYPSGHSTQSGAAATVLAQVFGANTAFDDATHEADGIAPRHFDSFDAAAQEAAMSRLYGGIHFRAAIEQGLTQGHCIGEKANVLKTLVAK